MKQVMTPKAMNEAFADAFNSRDIRNLLSLYEKDARLCVIPGGEVICGIEGISEVLSQLLLLPGVMTSLNAFCIQFGELALLRANWRLNNEAGDVLMEGSSAEVIRQQQDGSWRYAIDHAVGAAYTSNLST